MKTLVALIVIINLFALRLYRLMLPKPQPMPQKRQRLKALQIPQALLNRLNLPTDILSTKIMSRADSAVLLVIAPMIKTGRITGSA